MRLETDFRPIVGDTVLVNGGNYKVCDIKWDLESDPEQCKIIVYIE